MCSQQEMEKLAVLEPRVERAQRDLAGATGNGFAQAFLVAPGGPSHAEAWRQKSLTYYMKYRSRVVRPAGFCSALVL